MSRTTYNLVFILTISLFGVFYNYFLDITTETYISNPRKIKSKDVYIQFEMDGSTEEKFGRFRKSITTPYGVYIDFTSDIPLQTVTIREVIIKSRTLDESYTYLSPTDEPIVLEFEENDTEIGSSIDWSSKKTYPIPYNKNDFLTASLTFETNIQGLRDLHRQEFNLVPRTLTERRLLAPEEARLILNKRKK